MFGVKKEEEEQMKCVTPNIVYREVLLHRGHRLTPTTDAVPSPPTLTVPEHVNDVESIYDGFEEEEPNVDLEELYGPRRTIQRQAPSPNLSRPLPAGVIPAVLPSCEEAEVDSIAFNILTYSICRLLWTVRAVVQHMRRGCQASLPHLKLH